MRGEKRIMKENKGKRCMEKKWRKWRKRRMRRNKWRKGTKWRKWKML